MLKRLVIKGRKWQINLISKDMVAEKMIHRISRTSGDIIISALSYEEVDAINEICNRYGEPTILEG